MPTMIPPAPSPVQVDTNEPTVTPPAPSPVQADTNEPARVATTAVVPSLPTTVVVPNLAPSKLPALT